jgi:hypothetical protein
VDRYRAGIPSLPVGAGDDDALGDDDEVIALTAEQEAALEASAAEIKRGNFLTPADLFALLKQDREGAPSPL